MKDGRRVTKATATHQYPKQRLTHTAQEEIRQTFIIWTDVVIHPTEQHPVPGRKTLTPDPAETWVSLEDCMEGDWLQRTDSAMCPRVRPAPQSGSQTQKDGGGWQGQNWGEVRSMGK